MALIIDHLTLNNNVNIHVNVFTVVRILCELAFIASPKPSAASCSRIIVTPEWRKSVAKCMTQSNIIDVIHISQ
jgi:hypothetical protein